jgi:hypothetical protein
MMEWLSPLLSGFLGALVGASWAAWRDRVQRQRDFAQQQLDKLYAPLLALRVEIKTLSQTREFFRDLGEQGWQDVTAATEGLSGEAKRRVTEERWPGYQRLIEYDEKKFREELLPGYRQMASVFREHLWLADYDTRDYYPKLIGFVSTWERYLAESLPPEVMKRLSISESELLPFYTHVQTRHDELRNRLRPPGRLQPARQHHASG